jgi:hypothetical protein
LPFHVKQQYLRKVSEELVAFEESIPAVSDQLSAVSSRPASTV